MNMNRAGQTIIGFATIVAIAAALAASSAHAAETVPFIADEWDTLTQFKQECAPDFRQADCINKKIIAKYGDHAHLFAAAWHDPIRSIAFVKIPDEAESSPAASANGDGQIY